MDYSESHDEISLCPARGMIHAFVQWVPPLVTEALSQLSAHLCGVAVLLSIELHSQVLSFFYRYMLTAGLVALAAWPFITALWTRAKV